MVSPIPDVLLRHVHVHRPQEVDEQRLPEADLEKVAGLGEEGAAVVEAHDAKVLQPRPEQLDAELLEVEPDLVVPPVLLHHSRHHDLRGFIFFWKLNNSNFSN